MNIAKYLQRLDFLSLVSSKTLHDGPFGQVLLVSSNPVAIKVIDKSETSQKYLERELKAVNLLKHEHLVKTLDVIQDSKAVCIVMEYAEKGNLFEYIDKNGALSEDVARKMFLQLTLGLDYIHSTVDTYHGFVHSVNLLIDKDLNLKIAHFEFSGELQCDLFTSRYAPHMTVDENFRYDHVKADMFSMGIVLYYMLQGRVPPRNQHNGIDQDEIEKLQASLNCQDLLVRLLKQVPEERPGIKEILQHDWLKEADAARTGPALDC